MGIQMKKVHIAALGLGLVCCMQAAIGSEVRNLDADAIRTQQSQIRMDAEARTGRFKHMSERSRSDLFTRQQRVEGLLQGVSKTTELNELQQIDLFNHLEAIEALVNAAEDERMICERYKPVGTKRPKTMCLTVAQRRAANEAAQQEMTTRDQR